MTLIQRTQKTKIERYAYDDIGKKYIYTEWHAHGTVNFRNET